MMFLDSLAIFLLTGAGLALAAFLAWCFYSFKECRLSCYIMAGITLPLMWAMERLG